MCFYWLFASESHLGPSSHEPFWLGFLKLMCVLQFKRLSDGKDFFSLTILSCKHSVVRWGVTEETGNGSCAWWFLTRIQMFEFDLTWNTSGKCRTWPFYVMRSGINGCIDLDFRIICLHICSLVLLFTGQSPDLDGGKNTVQLVLGRQQINTVEWNVYFIKGPTGSWFSLVCFLSREAGDFSLGSSTANNSISLLLDSSPAYSVDPAVDWVV